MHKTQIQICISTKSAKHKSGSIESTDYKYTSTKSVIIQVRIICRSMKSVTHKYISGQKFEVSWRGKLLLRQNTSTHICSEVDICTSSKYIAESNTDLYFHRKYKYRVQWWTALEEYFHIDRKYCNSRQNMKEFPVELSPN